MGFFDTAAGGWRSGTPADYEPKVPEAVKQAQAVLDRCQDRYDEAKRRWEDAAVAVRAAEARGLAKPIVLPTGMDNGLGPRRMVSTQEMEELETLREKRETLHSAMGSAGRTLVEARMAHADTQRASSAWSAAR